MNEFNPDVRTFYLSQLLDKKDNGNVKIITGLRRTGKSILIKQFAKALEQEGVAQENIIRVDFEATGVRCYTSEETVTLIKRLCGSRKHVYLLLDEVSRVNDWETAINTVVDTMDADIYLIASNAGILSKKFRPNEEGTTDVINVLPFSMPEFIKRHEYVPSEEVYFPQKDHRVDYSGISFRGKDNINYSLEEVYYQYVRYGGMPVVSEQYSDNDRLRILFDAIYSNVVVRDILEYEKRNGRMITDPLLLTDVISIMIRSIGSHISATSVGNQLMTEKKASRAFKPATRTIETYMQALVESYMFSKVSRYDIRNNVVLKTLDKYYLVDTGLYNYLMGMNNQNRPAMLENLIYYELIRRGYTVYNGKIDRDEIDFVLQTSEGRVYVQSCYDLADDTGRKAVRALRRIRDSYPKIVAVFNGENRVLYDGIREVNALEFLMGADLPGGDRNYR